jgi:3-hydroxy-9,10-secoandrosta-1,3,5(10)-triene-9,17-dione monooxygenase
MVNSQTIKHTAPFLDELLVRARDLVPIFKGRAVETENLRRIPDANMADLRDAGFCRLYTPKTFGGFELDWGAHCKIAEEVARGCGSSAWFVAVVLSHSWMVARFCEAAQRTVLKADPDAVIASAFTGKSEMKRVDGGYQLTGTWAFASGIHHASWTVVGAPVVGGEALPPGLRPPYRMALLKAGQYDIIDDWHAAGLKGTGSNSLKVDNQFVPDDLTVLSDEMTGAAPAGAALHDSYIYGVEFVPYLESSFVGPLIGAAKGAVDDYLSTTKARVGREFGEKVVEQEGVQVRVAESVMDGRSPNHWRAVGYATHDADLCDTPVCQCRGQTRFDDGSYRTNWT